MYKAALLGCGKRSDAHAQAYAGLRQARLVAACSRNADLLDSFCARFNVPGRYRDLATLLEREKPDLLHVVTAPRRRCEALQLASALGVPAVLLEKPIALKGEDYRQVAELAANSRTRFTVNTQLHYHPANVRLRELVADGQIGEVRLMEATARSTLVNQGPHVLQLASGYTGGARPRRVFAQVAGAEALAHPKDPSPDNALATIELDGGARVVVAVGEQVAPVTSARESRFLHKQVVVHGTRGYVRWTMFGWESLTAAGYAAGEHDYFEQDRQAQRALTEAMCDWLDDERRTPPINLRQAVVEFNALLGMYVSALRRQVIELPVEPPAGLLEELRKTL
jgi:predicted dehydrogenase